MEYRCPICNERIKRELLIFIGHTEGHIADEIKKKHPDWAEADGICKRCIEHYRKMMKGQGGG